MAVFTQGDVSFHYWPVEEGKLIAGRSPVGYKSYQCKQYLKHLLDLGVRTFISLQEEDEVARKPFPFYHDALERLAKEKGVEVSFIRMPIMDGTTISSPSLIHLLDMIDSANRRNQMVYLHCLAGHGRTATVVGCWLVRQGMSGDMALKRITELRHHDSHLREKKSPQKPGQVARVACWSERIDVEPRLHLSKPFRYYFRNFQTRSECEKDDAISVSRRELLDALKSNIDLPIGSGVFIVVDKKGSEIILLYSWAPEAPVQKLPDDPVFELELPYFYDGRPNNVTFIETRRAWGKKPIRTYARAIRLSELQNIFEHLPEKFYQDCVPGCRLGRSLYYSD
ncbi:dual specificity protein phosphatase family protein [Aliikangiella sp. G2MR2-5]|uniref:protein-tyrosine phosphatase family protein n=1 Tax=Aliikangiella sp. G2MR2-5 TaxID=2788943 RepID=UPI0018ABBE45|nr:dual specificity protein phosphatase family protein [Aliikangiella sp. G2MR2-5]